MAKKKKKAKNALKKDGNIGDYTETFGPNEEDVKPVKWIIDKMASNWPQSSWEFDANTQLHEAAFLKLDISKAKFDLNWRPTWSLEITLEKIIIWHRAWLNNENVQKLSLDEINKYMDDMNFERR